ncbi:MAG: putative lipid flippase FtsW [Actinomycetia bacterium]|nr:putative lipid flippase FtsW [Actinomycetes bacterium]
MRKPSPKRQPAPTARQSQPRPRPKPKAVVPKPSTWYLLVGLVGVLVVIGLVMVLSASSVQSQREFGSTWSYFLRQSIWTVIGLVALVVMARIDYRRWRPLVPVLLVISFALLVLVLVPGIGLKVNGARSWLGRGPIRMQPAELVKLALLLFCADLLARRHDRMDDARLTLVPVLVVVGTTAVLMMLQPDLGSTMVMGAIVFSVLFVAGVPLGRLTGVFTVGSAGALVLALSKKYRRDRLLAFLNPAKDPGNTGYQINQSLMGVASGGWWGVGLGESRAKWGFLPNAYSDFIFAIIAEELGLLGALLVVGLFLAFGVIGIRAALRAPDRFGTLVAAGITAWILAQAFINIGGVVGILPITGLTLPFVSYGGTSLLITMAATGLLLNVASHGPEAKKRTSTATRRSTNHPAMAGR